jgi:hypothetical protein
LAKQAAEAQAAALKAEKDAAAAKLKAENEARVAAEIAAKAAVAKAKADAKAAADLEAAELKANRALLASYQQERKQSTTDEDRDYWRGMINSIVGKVFGAEEAEKLRAAEEAAEAE